MSCKLCSLFSSNYITGVLAYVPEFNCSGTSKTLSVCVWGGVLTVMKCIYLSPTYLYFMQDMEDRCILLTSSTRFVNLPFQEHRMMKKHHMDQNPYISSLCPKLGVVSDNMTQGDDVAKSLGPTDTRCGRPAPLLGRSARVWR
jgi:hypothetical protein